jgi:hypothetical protein
MPTSLEIAAFVLGSVLILIAIIGGKFKIFIAEISNTVNNVGRGISGLMGTVLLIAAALISFDGTKGESDGPSSKALTMYDLAGTYTLKYASDITGLETAGIFIKASSRTEGQGTYTLPMNIEGAEELFDVERGTSAIYIEGESNVILNGNKIRIRLDGYSIWRDVSISENGMTWTWNTDGKKHEWVFDRNQ